MKAEDLKTKTEDELKKMLMDARKEQMNLRFQRSGGTLDNTSLMLKNRRMIARVKTFLNKKPESAVNMASPKKATEAVSKKTTKKSSKAA